MTDILVPTLGESISEATVARWLKQPGDAVATDEVLVELETDKVTQEIRAPSAGRLSEVLVAEGATVEIGAVLGRVSAGEGDAPAAPAAPQAGRDAHTPPEAGREAPRAPAGADPVEPVTGGAMTATPEAPLPETSIDSAGAGPGDADASEGDGLATGRQPPAQAQAQPGGQGRGGEDVVEIAVPQMGESVSVATVAEWLKREGDPVARDEALVVLETDKASQEIAAPEAGVLEAILAPAQSDVEVGTVLGRIRLGAAASAPAGAAAAPGAADSAATATATAPAAGDRLLRHGPAAEKSMRETGVAASDVGQPSGRDGRVTKGDVLAAAEQQGQSQGARPAAPPAPSSTPVPSRTPAPAPAGRPAEPAAPRALRDREERVKMTRLRQSIASRLKDAQNTAAILTTFNEVDMTAIMDLRRDYKDLFEKKHGVKLGFMGLFVKAAVQALKDFPAVNAEIDGTDIVYKNYYDIGVAVSTPQGLVVPVVRDCDTKTIAEIEEAIAQAAVKARDGKLTLADMTGGSFSITNGGIFGSLLSTPILNPPQSAILGMHAIKDRPMAVAGQVVVRPMMYLALSYDHRLVDGREAVSFLVRIKDAIEDPRRLVMAL